MATALFPQFPAPPRIDATVDDRHDLMFLDPDKALDAIDPEQRHAIENWLSGSDDREKDLRYMANRGFLADVFGEADPGPERYDYLKNEFAWNNLGVDVGVAVDDDEFHELVKASRQKNRDRKQLFAGIAEAADSAAFSVDAERAAERKKLAFSNPEQYPGFRADDLPELYRVWNDAAAARRAEVDPLRPTARAVESLLRKAQAEGEGVPFSEFTAAAVATLKPLSERERATVLELVRQAFSPGKDKAPGIEGKRTETGLYETIDRGLTRGAGNTLFSLKAAGERALELLPGTDDDSDERAIDRQLRSLMQGNLAPITPGGGAWGGVKAGIGGAAQSVAPMVMSSLGMGGLALTAVYYQQESYERFRAEGASEAAANGMAALSGIAQAALDKVQWKIAAKLPGISRVSGSLARVAKPWAYVAREGAKFTGGVAVETGIEVFQNHYADAVAQQVGAWISDGIDDPEWSRVHAEALGSIPELAMTMIPLMAFGSGRGTINDIQAARALARSPEMLRAAGFGPSQAMAIVAAENPVTALRSMWSEREPMKGAPAGATPGEVAAAAVADLQESLAVAPADMLAPGVRDLRRTGKGWEVEQEDGTTVAVTDAAALGGLMVQMGRAHTRAVADAIIATIDGFAEQDVAEGVEPRWSMRRGDNTRVTLGEDGKVTAMDNTGAPVLFDESTLEKLADELRNAGMTEGVIRGMNYALRDDAGRLVRHYSLGESADATTILHERVERLVREGRVSMDEIWRGANVLSALPAFDPARIRDPGQRKIAEKLRRIALDDESLSPAGRRETLVELIVADVIGRFRDGTNIEPGSIQAAIQAQALASRGVERGALRSLRQLFMALRRYLGALFGIAARIRKARQSGELKEGDDWTSLVDKLLGTTAQTAHDAAVMEAAGIGTQPGGLTWLEHPNDATGSSKYAYVTVRGAFLQIRVADHANRSSLVSDSEIKGVYGRKLIRQTGAALDEWTPGRVNIIVPASLDSASAKQVMEQVLNRLPSEAFALFDEKFAKKTERFGAETTVRSERRGMQYIWTATIEDNESNELWSGEIGQTDFAGNWTRKSQSTSAVAESSMPGSGSAKTGERDTGTAGSPVNEQSPAPADGADAGATASLGRVTPDQDSSPPGGPTEAEVEAFHGGAAVSRFKPVTFWSSDPTVAESYTKGRSFGGGSPNAVVTRAGLTLQNSLDFSDVGTNPQWWTSREVMKEAGVSGELMEEMDGAYAEEQHVGIPHLFDPAYGDFAAQIITELEALGYDSVSMIEDGRQAWVVFNPDSIRILRENEQSPAPADGADAGATASLGRVTPDQDAEYMAAVEAGDMATAQRMVDAAAKVAGYSTERLMWHGGTARTVISPRDFYTHDRPVAFLSSSPEHAAVFAGKGGAVHRVYYLPGQQVETEEFNSDYEALNGTPFDTVISRGIRDAGFTVDEVVITRPSQVKSADPITRDESGNVIPLSKRFNPERDEITFSLGSVNTLEALANRLEAAAGERGARAKLETYADMARTFEGMARAARANEETEIVLRVGEIEKERRAMQDRLFAEYEEEIYAAHGDLLGQPELAGAFENPLIDFLFRKKESGKPFRRSRILSKAAAIRQGIDIHGQYDGIDGLPRWFFSADGLTPDKITKEVVETKEFGWPEDARPDTHLWGTVKQILESSEKYRKTIRRVEGEIMEAKDRARREAREWAAAERAKLSASDKRDEHRSLVTLDAMLMHLPAEVRKKVGGLTAVAELKSNDARRRHFLRTVDRIETAMEDWMRREFAKQIHEELHKARPKRVAGEKDRGRLGVNVHTWLDTATAVMGMSEGRAAERAARLEAIVGGDTMSEDEIADLNRAWDLGTGEDAARMAAEQESAILELFTGISQRDRDGRYRRSAGEMETALDAIREQVSAGRKEWQESMEERRDRRAGRRAGLKLDSGNDGSAAARQAAKEAEEGLSAAISRGVRKGMSLEQFAGDLFGRESDTHRWIEETANEAHLTAEGLWQDSQRRFVGFLASLWPRTSKVKLLRKMEALQDRRQVPGAGNGFPKLSEMEAIHLTMLWSDVDSRAWLRKQGFGDGEPEEPGGERGPDVQASLEAYLSPEARRVRSWLADQYDAQYDVLNTVFRRLHGVNMPRVRNYAPRIVLSGKDAAVGDPTSGSGSLTSRGVFAGFTKRRRPDVAAAVDITDSRPSPTGPQ